MGGQDAIRLPPVNVDREVASVLSSPTAGLVPQPAPVASGLVQRMADGGSAKPQYYVPPRGKANFPQGPTPDYPGRYAGLGREMMRAQRDRSAVPDIRVDRERMREWLARQPLSENIEDRRGYDPTMDNTLGPTMGYARGGLANPVLGSSAMRGAAKTAHFSGVNERAALPKGGHLSAINVPAVRSPGAHLINSTVPGRTDRIAMRARTGSFVIPADVVSGLGQGNTMAGAKMWGDMLAHGAGGGGGIKRAPATPNVNPMGRARAIAGPIARPPAPPRPMKTFAEGGEVDDGTTPIVTAGGEMLVDPEIVTALGQGDSKAGTKMLCDAVEMIRKQVQAYQRKLPRPSS